MRISTYQAKYQDCDCVHKATGKHKLPDKCKEHGHPMIPGSVSVS